MNYVLRVGLLLGFHVDLNTITCVHFGLSVIPPPSLFIAPLRDTDTD